MPIKIISLIRVGKFVNVNFPVCWVLLWAGLIMPYTRAAAIAPDQAIQVDAGRRIYREGVTLTGGPIIASMRGDIPVQGAHFACANCHKRSGLGSAEGNQSAPPITQEFLFQPRDRSRKEYYAPSPNLPASRTAYTEESLRRAIIEGVDPVGRILNPLMPRYQLNQQEITALVAYLKSLSVTVAPGVDDTTMHFATIFAGDVPADSRKAMLAVLDAYVGIKNAGTRHEERRVKYGPWHMESMYKAYRKWQLHTWELKGDPSTWPEQLESQYRRQPVFAVLSGIGTGSWQPVHDFCESHATPCLFPTVNQPPTAEGGFYSLYFSKGLKLEAEVLAKVLSERKAHAKPIAQLYTRASVTGASAFREAWLAKDDSDAPEDLAMPDDQAERKKLWNKIGQHPAKTLVLWLDEKSLVGIEMLALRPDQRLVLSGTLWGDRLPALPPKLKDKADVLYTLTLPEAQGASLRGLQTWLKTKNVPLTQPLVQANAYFAVLLANEAVTHILQYYSPEYLIETIEHKLDRMQFNSLYPRLSLGPGQRFAAKGCYIVPLNKLDAADAVAFARWVVP